MATYTITVYMTTKIGCFRSTRNRQIELSQFLFITADVSIFVFLPLWLSTLDFDWCTFYFEDWILWHYGGIWTVLGHCHARLFKPHNWLVYLNTSIVNTCRTLCLSVSASWFFYFPFCYQECEYNNHTIEMINKAWDNTFWKKRSNKSMNPPEFGANTLKCITVVFFFDLMCDGHKGIVIVGAHC